MKGISTYLALFVSVLLGLGARASSGLQQQTHGATPQMVETYPIPANRTSNLFEVEVSVDRGVTWHRAAAAQHTRESMANNFYGSTTQHLQVSPWVHWAKFGLSGSALVRVTKKAPRWPNDYISISSVRFLPERYGIPPVVVNGSRFTFAIERGQSVQAAIHFQGVGYTDIDTLFVFACPPMPPKPATVRPDMLYYPAGVYYLGSINTVAPYQTYIEPMEVPAHIRTIYLDAGAYVIGSFDFSRVTGPIEVIGPGVLSGEGTTWEYVAQLGASGLHAQGWNPATNSRIFGVTSFSMLAAHYSSHGANQAWSHDLTVNGPTLLQSPHYNLWAYDMTGRLTIENTQIISPWTYNTDGFLTGATTSATISNCFMFNNDNMLDGEHTHLGRLTVKDCVLAGRTAFLLGYGENNTSRAADARFSGIDFVNVFRLNDAAPFHCAVVSRVNHPLSIVERQFYSDITSSPVSKMFHLEFKIYPWHNPPPPQPPVVIDDGHLRNIYFTNIRGTQTGMSTIETPTTFSGTIGPIYFTNVWINGVKLTAGNFGQFFQVTGTWPTMVFQ